MIDRGVDPLLCNEDEEDVMSIVKQQYGFLTSELKKVQEFIIESSMRVIAPTIIEEQARREEALIEDFNKMVRFLDSMIHSLQERLTNIEKDRLLLRAYALKKEVSKRILALIIYYLCCYLCRECYTGTS